MITIDGAMGEGGGQVLRTALALALVTGRPLRVENIRAGRKKPGLLSQHLTAARAAAEVSGAHLRGDAIGSAALLFEPGPVRPGSYRFAVGTAGSATLVLQTVLPALVLASGPSDLVLEGGTHNPWAPPFDFLNECLLPLLGRMGPKVTAALERPGFYPAGGGRLRVWVQPAARLEPLELLERGRVLEQRARALVARLPEGIAARELAVVERELGWPDRSVERIEDSAGPGNVLFLEMRSEAATEIVTAFGERGVRAEDVAAKAVAEARRYLAAEVPVGLHLADQMLVPLALAGGGRFRTLRPSAHTQTNAEVIRRMMPLRIAVAETGPDACEIAVEPA